ncbi:MAG: YicC family protein [Schwartzia sp.]|nr:YicC family protein [Schwartzia sp. (in: firmicutes)]MBR1886199.1 YicC family protein [Schwartzia sp. (in: firmicutes)]
MTGFGTGLSETDDYRVAIEVKAVNQRYLDIEIRAPHMLDVFTEKMKTKAKEYASRGKLTIGVQFLDKRERDQELRLDKPLAIAYHKALNEISDLLRLPRPDDVQSIAAYPGVLTVVETQDVFDGAEPVLLGALEQALRQFTTMREVEGENLKADFMERIGKLSGYTEEVAMLGPEIVRQYRERLETTIKEFLNDAEIDEARIIQETAIYSDRVNFTEEMVRLRSHFEQFRSILENAEEPVGRKLDFLIQEMNREVNTTASKANNVRAAKLAVEMKSEIEKLREQVQNIE